MKHQKWEYLVCRHNRINEEELNEIGAGGWELIHVSEIDDIWGHYFFKRPILEEVPEEELKAVLEIK